MHELFLEKKIHEITPHQIMEALPLSETAIRKNLIKLVKAGYVIRHERRNSRGWRFTTFTIEEDLVDFVEFDLLGGY